MLLAATRTVLILASTGMAPSRALDAIVRVSELPVFRREPTFRVVLIFKLGMRWVMIQSPAGVWCDAMRLHQVQKVAHALQRARWRRRRRLFEAASTRAAFRSTEHHRTTQFGLAGRGHLAVLAITQTFLARSEAACAKGYIIAVMLRAAPVLP